MKLCGMTYCFGHCSRPAEYEIEDKLFNSKEYSCRKHLGEIMAQHTIVGIPVTTVVNVIDNDVETEYR